MVDDDISQRADGVVEMPSVLNAEALGQGDLDACDVVAVPGRLDHHVREAQVQDLVETHLPEEMIDPVKLRLVDELVELPGKGASGLQVMAEGFLDDHACAGGQQLRVGEPFDHRREQARRDLQVEDRDCESCRAARLTPAKVRGSEKSPLDIRQARGEAREDLASMTSPSPGSPGGRGRAAGRYSSPRAPHQRSGNARSPRRSSRYSDRNVIFRARSPVMPKITSASAVEAAAASRSLSRLRATISEGQALVLSRRCSSSWAASSTSL